MEAWIVSLIISLVSLVLTTLIGYLVKRYLDKFFARRDAKEEEDRKRDAELNQLKMSKVREERRQDMEASIKKEIAPIKEKIDILEHKVQLNNNATLSSLRNSITTCYYKCCEKGYRNDYDYTNIHDMYEDYKRLDGNSYISDIMARFDLLPVKENTVPTKVVKRTPKKILNEKKK